MKIYTVYIIANKKDGVLYIGQTGDLKRRISQHKRKVHPTTFSARYNFDKLVYFENYKSKEKSLLREGQLKIRLIEENNRSWKDLFKELK